jgi:uncharacterized protein YijF (DUF1287 family)
MRRAQRRQLVLGLAAVLAAGAALAAHAWRLRHAFQPVAAAGSALPLASLSPFQRAVVGDLERQVRAGIRYQDGYYPGGEPPPGVGVCTDVVIRAYRAAGVDLHEAVARDVRAHLRDYKIQRPDPGIDHRRCRNLVVFFRRYARALPGTGSDWQPGDLVFWDFNADGRVDHVGVIANHRAPDGTPTVVHHWPGRPVAETDGLYRFPIAHHFRWPGA